MIQLVDLLNTFGAWLFRSMVRLSLELTVLAAVVLAVIYLLKVRSPRLRHLFWCLVLAKPVVTFVIASPISLYWFLHPAKIALPQPVLRAAVVRPVEGDYGPRTMANRPTPRFASMPEAPPPPPWWAGMRADGVVAVAWLTGAMLLALRLLFGFAFVSFLRRTAVPQEDGPLAEAAERARRTLGLRGRTVVALSPAVHGPVLAGVLRPAVLLPGRMMEQCTPQQIEMVVAHELAHARRMDNLALLVQRLAEVVLFFHPVVWLCGWIMRRESESACDYAVIEAYSAAARADQSVLYADSLTRVAEMRSGITRRLLINTFAAAESNLAGRVRRITEGRLTRRTLTWTLASVGALVAVAFVGLPTAAGPTDKTQKTAPAPAGSGQGETAMKTAGQELRYGFRYDPMRYAQNDVSVPAALVRAQVLGAPRAGDDKIIADYVAEVLSKQRPDGSFDDKSGDTGRSLDWLAVAGVGTSRPEFLRGYEAMLRQRDDEAKAGAPGDFGQAGLVLVPINGLRAACMTDLVQRPEVRRTVRWMADHPAIWLEKTCPWGATFALRALWHARGVEDVDAGIKTALAWVGREMNNAGCVKYWDPYAVVAAVGTIDTPEARAILLRQVPMLLRGQEADGGWGPNKWDMQTLDAFRALKTHGLLDKLRALPPLPPDWRVVRSIPAPDGKLGWMTYQAGRLWIHNYDNGEIIGISPQDGSVARRLRVPDVFPVGLGQWDGSLAVTQKDSGKRVVKVNPESGAIEAEFPIPFVADPMCATMVGGRLWIADSWLFPGWVVDPAHPEKVPSSDPNVDWDPAFRLERLQAGTCPNGIAVLGDGVWQTDYFARVMVKSGPDGKLSDWGERPFGGWPPDIAYDGQNLWALDSPNKRICIIEKTETGMALAQAEPAVAAASAAGAAPSAAVKREGDKVVVGGLEEAKWGGTSPQQDTVIGAMTAVAQALGNRDAGYDYVSGVSGSAFRVQIGSADWRIEAPFGIVGFDESQPAAAALGWRLTWTRADPKDAEAVRARNDAVVRSLDAGCPVLLAREECSIIVGYDASDKSFIIRQVGAGQPGYAPLKDELAAWHAVGIIQQAGPAGDRRAALLKSLSLASSLWQMPDAGGFAEGKRAYGIWVQRLEDDAAYADAKKAGAACECNGYAYCCLDTARAAAAGYLASAAAQFDGEAADHVRKAAALYQQVVDTLRKKRDDLPEPWMLFPWDLDRIGGWTPAHRHAQARVLREAAALEEKALVELALALKAAAVEPAQAASAARPDYTKLSLKGDGHVQDSFTLTVQAADRMFGRETDYGAVYALSSNCFSPAVNLGEDCTSWWHVYGDLQGAEMETVAAAFGLRVEKLPVTGYEGPDKPGPDEPGPVQTYQTERAATIRAALDAGAVVITDYGWEVWKDQTLAPWCWWGIITRANPGDRGLLGACLAADPGQAHGYVDRVVWPHSAWALYPAETTLVGRDAVLKALTNAVARVRGVGAFAPGKEYVYGLQAMDAWIARMEKVPVCQPCYKSDPTRVWSCALDNGRTTTAASQAAAAWLRKSAGAVSAAARPRMEAAAAHYDRIVALLAPAVTGVGGESYQQFIGDLAKQKAHADVLRQIKAELAAAADEMAEALAAEGVRPPPATGPGSADQAKVDLRAYGEAQDSFSLTMVAVARLFGLKADYDTVYALSTNGFAPDLCPSEPCKAMWRCLGRGQCIDLVGSYLGLEARPLQFPEAPPLPAPDAQGRTWGSPAYSNWLQDRNKACSAVIERAFQEGAVVVTSGGWLHADYTLWGIVTGADPATGAISGVAAVDGRNDTMDHVESYWTVAPAKTNIPLADAERTMLSRVVERIRGQSGLFAPGKVIFGLPAMDLWIAQMQKPAFQPDDPSSSAGNARLCALYSLVGARRSASYLRGMATRAPEAARAHLEVAAESYEGIVRLLGPFGGSASNAGCGDIMGDPAKQKAHAESVLMPVKAHLAAAADEITAALAAEGVQVAAAARLSDQPLTSPPGAVVPPGALNALQRANDMLPQGQGKGPDAFEWDAGRGYIRQHLMAMLAAGWDTDYATLMCVSGSALSFAYNRADFRAKYADEMLGMDERIARATGFGYEWVHCESAEDAWQIIKTTVDSGRLARGEYMEQVTFAGYADAANEAGRKVLAVDSVFVWPPKWWTWAEFEKWWADFGRFRGAIGRHSGSVPQAPARDVALGVMRDAVQWSRSDPRAATAKPGTIFGLAALEAYAADIANTSLGVKDFDSPWRGCHGVLAQAQATSCLSDYLRRSAALFPAETRRHLERAADEYSAAWDAWGEWAAHLHRGTSKDDANWQSPEHRAAGAAAVRRVTEHETTGIGELRLALAAEGVSVPAAISSGAAEGVRPAKAPVRLVLDGVPRVGYDRSQWCPFSACFTSCLNYLGEKDVDYTLALGTSGSAFRLQWSVEGWDMGNVGICHMAEDATEPFRRAFEAAGYQCESLFRPGDYTTSHGLQATADEATFRARIIDSIGRGVPVIAIGVIGPPEPCIITGYDEGGDVLVGWSYFQGGEKDVEPSGYFRKRDWYASTQGLILTGRKSERPPLSETYRRALQWALVVAKTTRIRAHYSGPAAYTAWSEAMMRDADFPKDDLAVLRERRSVHMDAMCMIAARREAATFLRRIADGEPVMADELHAAAQCYEQENVLPGASAEADQVARLADRAVRREVAVSILAARDKDVQAANHIEKALLAVGVVALAAPGASTSEGAQRNTRTERNMAAKVRREGDKVTIEGLPAMSWGSSCDTTFAGAMEAALAVTEHPYTATQIMGYSGLAFRVRWTPDAKQSGKGWCPSIPVGEFQEEQDAAAKATGWRFRSVYDADDAKAAQMGRHADQIAAALDAGLPAVGYPDASDLNVAVAYGYEGAGADRKFRWLTYSSGKQGKLIPAADTGPWVMVPQGFGGAPDARRRLLDSLSIAVRNWRHGTSLHPNEYPYAWGESALEAWQRDLARAASFTDAEQKQLFYINWWNFEAFQDARTRAAEFLKDEAPALGADGRAAVLRAAALYGQEAKLLVDQIGKGEAFFGPWGSKGFADWTPAVRAREQKVLADALALERQAVAEIETALHAEGVEIAPEPPPVAQTTLAAGVKRDGSKVWIDMPSAGKGESNWAGSGLAIILDYLHTLADYDALMGDLGLAFVMQASDQGPKINGALDVGWWPLDPVMVPTYLDFVSRTVGREVRYVGGMEQYGRDVEKFYNEKARPILEASINAGRPVLADLDFWQVITGYDDGKPPVLGFCPAGDANQQVGRMGSYPWALITVGEPVERMDRRQADLEALKHAVALGRDQAPLANGYVTGRKAFALWAQVLRDTQNLGENFWHYNVVRQLGNNRRCAVAYLRAMAARHDGQVAKHLSAAADIYQQTLADLTGADTSKEAMTSKEGRERLARLAEKIAASEAQAVGEMEAALVASGAQGPVARGDGGTSLSGLSLSAIQPPEKVWGSSLPRAMAVALKQAGTDVSFSDMVAGSDWAFGFDYSYGNWHVAALFFDQFSWLPEQLGYQFETVGCADRDRVWQFITSHVGAGTPVMCTLLDGGIITACREMDGKREFNFDGVPGAGWRDLTTTHPLDRCAVAVKVGAPKGRAQIMRASLPRALAAARQAQSALDAYLADVQDPSKDFADQTEWFCWATFEHLTARECCAAWLRSAADAIGGDARKPLLAAADAYDRAFTKYCDYNAQVTAALGASGTAKDKLRAPASIAALSAALKAGIAEERAAVAQLAAAVAATGGTAAVSADAGGAAAGGIVLDKLVARPRWASHMGAIGGCLDFLGRPVSDGWLYGVTGYAFALNIERGMCPSAPYVWMDDGQSRLGRNAGYTVLTVASTSKDDIPEKRKAAWDMARKALDAGTPCFAYDLEFGDYFVVNGYDATGYYYRGLGSNQQRGPLAWDKLGTTGNVGIVDVEALSLRQPADDRAATMDALRFAVAMQRKGPSDNYTPGIRGYDVWIAALERAPRVGTDGPDAVSGHGACFNAQFWAECRRNAVAFLKEAKGRLKDEKLDPLFDEAAADYGVVADKLGEVAGMFPMDDKRETRTKDVALCARAIAALKAARQAEARGLLVLARIAGEPLKPADLAERKPVASGAPAASGRAVLDGVRKVAYHTDKWRFTPFCNALDACLQYLGEPEHYDYLMCTSGAAFRMNWWPKAWDGGNSDILGMAAETLEPMRRAFRSAGYQMLPVAKAQTTNRAEDLLREDTRRLGGELTDEAGFRRRIVESINNGRPVIAFGIVGPPEACVITGYDESGDMLLGWNVFQDDEKAEAEPSGYFRMRDWYGKTRGLLLIGEKAAKPDAKELDIETLKWALQVLRTQQVRKSAAGPAAFDAWAADMLNDEYFPKDNINVLSGRLECHYDSMTVTAFRGGGSVTAYLTAVAGRQPAMAEQLKAAADCLENEDVVHGVAPWEKAQMARLADPAVRRQVADSILHARDMHMQAAEHIEKALLAAGVPPDDVPRPVLQAAGETRDRDQRVVLDRVPKVGFGVVDGNVAMTPFPACLKACLEYMGDDLGFGSSGKYPRDAVYAYLMGTTGAAFRLLWKPGWHGDNVASFAIYDDAGEIFRRGFAAAGYACDVIHRGPEAPFRQRVIASIRDRGRPVIAHGIIGPPEETIVAGYDEGGRVAIGWSFFQDRAIAAPGVEFEPNGMFRKRDWEAETWSMLVIGEKVQMPERRQAYTDALRNALHIMRDPVRGGKHNGIAAYDAWAEHILRDGEVAAGGGPDDAFIVHSDAADVVAEGRYYASVFLRQTAGYLPEAKEDLAAAAECYKAEHDLMWKVWGEVGSNVPSDATRKEFLKPDVRRRIVPIIRQARDKDAEAAGRIEKALLTLGVPAKDIPATRPSAGEPTAL